MRRRAAAKHGHWALVVGCLGIAFLPLGARDWMRTKTLDLQVRLASLFAKRAPTQQERLAVPRVQALEAQVTELERALLAAGAAQQVVKLDPSLRLVPAEVLPLTGNSDLVHRVALARGSSDGVRVGLPVLADGALVGRVASVTPGTSEVRLVADPVFRIRATVRRPDGDVEGMIYGTGSSLLVFEPELLDETAAEPVLRVGETILCSRASVLCGVPALLGVIERTERRAGSPLTHARVRPTREFSGLGTLRRVIVVVTKEETAG